jgi:hypothetical protein
MLFEQEVPLHTGGELLSAVVFLQQKRQQQALSSFTFQSSRQTAALVHWRDAEEKLESVSDSVSASQPSSEDGRALCGDGREQDVEGEYTRHRASQRQQQQVAQCGVQSGAVFAVHECDRLCVRDAHCGALLSEWDFRPVGRSASGPRVRQAADGERAPSTPQRAGMPRGERLQYVYASGCSGRPTRIRCVHAIAQTAERVVVALCDASERELAAEEAEDQHRAEHLRQDQRDQERASSAAVAANARLLGHMSVDATEQDTQESLLRVLDLAACTGWDAARVPGRVCALCVPRSERATPLQALFAPSEGWQSSSSSASASAPSSTTVAASAELDRALAIAVTGAGSVFAIGLPSTADTRLADPLLLASVRSARGHATAVAWLSVMAEQRTLSLIAVGFSEGQASLVCPTTAQVFSIPMPAGRFTCACSGVCVCVCGFTCFFCLSLSRAWSLLSLVFSLLVCSSLLCVLFDQARGRVFRWMQSAWEFKRAD